MKDLALIECGHMFHTECLQVYIKLQIDSKLLPVKCPLQECRKQIPDTEIRSLIELEFHQKLERFQLELFVEQNSTFYHFCPSPDCINVIEWDAGKGPSKLECPVCAQTHCLRCKTNWHEGFTCEEFLKIKEANPDDMTFYSLAKESKLQQCTQCKFWVQKTEGCDHITCRCKYEFCYICGGKHQECGCN
ncbi:unnamed protein product [Moneuplotes crassus]|uniref:RBR-type E3 ubiquitin transferase n=1 Tax=Euplotes crassus TaxID=5936 RepID=A0AAD1UFY0_EUPCR|nr:unnamed protein product [Moneuplotes crassus]